MRILFLGAGGTGGYFGGRAAQAGADVTFLLRSARAERVLAQGLTIQSPLGDTLVRPRVVTTQTLKAPYDVVVLSCKAYDLESAIESIRPAVGPDTLVLPILNGMAHYDRLDDAFGQAHVLGGMCQILGTLGPNGEVVQMPGPGKPRLVFGQRAGLGESARCREIATALGNDWAEVVLSTDIYQDIWEKFVSLSALAAGTCLMRGSVGEICHTDAGAAILLSLFNESASVARANGHALRESYDQMYRAFMSNKASTATSSMFRDLRNGARVEGDHIVGDMVRRAAHANVPAPYLSAAFTNLQVYMNRLKTRQAA